MVSRATLHNADQIQRKDVREGDTVVLRRSGDVIPEVVRAVPELRPEEAKPYRPSDSCPACGMRLVRVEEEVKEYCPNPSCPGQRVEKTVFFASRRAMDIDGLGQEHVSQLVEKGLVSDVADLYSLTQEKLVPLDRMGEKLAEKILKSIDASRRRDLPRILFALGIRFVGEHVARVLATAFGSVERLAKATEEELQETPEVGPKIAASVRDFFRRKENRDLLEKLRKGGVSFPGAKRREGRALAGRMFVFTGALPRLSREEAGRLCEENGGRVSSSVSRKTDFVVAGEAAGSKLEKARDLGVKVIDEAEFLRMIGQAPGDGE
jgi:DNA ligase (NAD+)